MATERLTGRRRDIARVIGRLPMTPTMLALRTGLTPNAVRMRLHELRRRGLARRDTPAKITTWSLTDEGRDWLRRAA